MPVTKNQYKKLNDFFHYYNNVLFESTLPECIISFDRNRKYLGTFRPDKWKKKGQENQPIHEINLNPKALALDSKFLHSIFVHELCHLQDQVFGKGAKWGYHTKKWGILMKAVGLYPSSTGEIGGKETGRRVSHYIIPNGKFENAFEAISSKDITRIELPYDPYDIQPITRLPSYKTTRSGIKTKYVCKCGSKVWGKSGLDFACKICKSDFSEL